MKPLDEPNMSDRTLLINVEDLINMAMGSSEKNIVNYKIIQTVLHILARQMRMLEQRVEIRIVEELEEKSPGDHEKKLKNIEATTNSSLRKSPRPQTTKSQIKETKEESIKNKEKMREEMRILKEKEGTVKRKNEKAIAKEKAKVTKDGSQQLIAEEKDYNVGDKEVEKERENQKQKESAEKVEGRVWREKDLQSEIKKAKSRGESGSRMATRISEVERQNEKVLEVERGPKPRADTRSRQSIEIVTRPEFDVLENLVKDIKKKTGPLPSLALPDNKELISELASGRTSLIDTMNAMQMNARVKAAEQAIGRMSELLTDLAMAGALPENFIDKIEELQLRPLEPLEYKEHDTSEAKSRITTEKSLAIHPTNINSIHENSSKPFVEASAVAKVTYPEMDDALRSLKEELTKNMQAMISKATSTAETAMGMARSVAEKLEVAVQINTRISKLYTVVSDYTEQLNGFDAGLTTQMQGFEEQMAEIRSDLKSGLKQLEQVNNNTETTAMSELTEHYEGLVSELDHTLHLQKSLTNFQNQLGDDVHGLVESVEMLREQKADRDEVVDGLRDKADNSRLVGLLSELEFAAARTEMDQRLEMFYEMLHKQDSVWMMALKDLSQIVDTKADLIQLSGVRDEAQEQLQELHQKLQELARILGEPKAAILTREVSLGGTCGACKVPALIEFEDASHGAPPPLPAMRLRPTGADDAETEEHCSREWKLADQLDNKFHICKRWCGGSHTLVTNIVRRQLATNLPLQSDSPLTKRFTGYGADGRLYMEEELQPCLECNVLSDDPKISLSIEAGAGDNGEKILR